MRVAKNPSARSYVTLHNLLFATFIVPAIILVIVVAVVLFFLLLPYSLWFYSPNFGLRKKDMAIVSVYLDAFQQLHPDLVRETNAARQREMTDRMLLQKIRFWPNEKDSTTICIPCIGTITETTYQFSAAAGLFALLEGYGMKRRVLWQFLKETVETNWGGVGEAEKARFREVEQKMCNHTLTDHVTPAEAVRYILWGWVRKRAEEYKIPDEGFGGMRVVPVQRDRVDWVLDRGVLLAPTDFWTQKLLKDLPKDIWGKAEKERDLEKGVGGYWQICDLRGELQFWGF
jgi:hypothetical protein